MLTKKQALKISVSLIKWLAFAGLLLMTGHVLILLCGYNLFIADEMIGLGIFPYIFAMIISYGFGFCSLHRCILSYIYLVSVCITYLRLIGFGTVLLGARLLVFIIGCVLIALTLYKKLLCSFEKLYLS